MCRLRVRGLLRNTATSQLRKTTKERNNDNRAMAMNFSQALPEILNRIDADLDKSVDRLFDFLKIQSVSTDPAYKDHCRAAADFVARATAGPESGLQG